jgi:hypothetical protein
MSSHPMLPITVGAFQHPITSPSCRPPRIINDLYPGKHSQQAGDFLDSTSNNVKSEPV